MWTFFHKLGSPPWLYAIAGAILRWLVPITLVALVGGVVWGLLFTAPDFRQGRSDHLYVNSAIVVSGCCCIV